MLEGLLIRLKDVVDPEVLGEESLKTLTGPYSLWGGAILGFFLGFILQKGRMAKYDTVSGLFRFQDFTFFRVGTILLLAGTILIHLFYSLGAIELQPPKSIPIANLLGGFLFGSGIAITGYCPGIDAAALGEGDLSSIPGLFGMMTGVFLYGTFFYGSWLDEVVKYIDWDHVAAADLYLHWPLIFIFSFMYVFFLIGITLMDWFIILFFSFMHWGDELDKLIEFLKGKKEKQIKKHYRSTIAKILRAESWSPLLAGLAFAFLELLSFLLSKRPLGTLRGVTEIESILLYVFFPNFSENSEYWSYLYSPYMSWSIILFISIIFGSFVSSLLSGEFRIIKVPKLWRESKGPSIMRRWFWAYCGGILVGFGGKLGGGCTLGMLISGVIQLTPGGFIFMFSLYAGAVITTWTFYNIKTLTFTRA